MKDRGDPTAPQSPTRGVSPPLPSFSRAPSLFPFYHRPFDVPFNSLSRRLPDFSLLAPPLPPAVCLPLCLCPLPFPSSPLFAGQYGVPSMCGPGVIAPSGERTSRGRGRGRARARKRGMRERRANASACARSCAACTPRLPLTGSFFLIVLSFCAFRRPDRGRLGRRSTALGVYARLDSTRRRLASWASIARRTVAARRPWRDRVASYSSLMPRLASAALRLLVRPASRRLR